jgi:hypothetical protein
MAGDTADTVGRRNPAPVGSYVEGNLIIPNCSWDPLSKQVNLSEVLWFHPPEKIGFSQGSETMGFIGRMLLTDCIWPSDGKHHRPTGQMVKCNGFV